MSASNPKRVIMVPDELYDELKSKLNRSKRGIIYNKFAYENCSTRIWLKDGEMMSRKKDEDIDKIIKPASAQVEMLMNGKGCSTKGKLLRLMLELGTDVNKAVPLAGFIVHHLAKDGMGFDDEAFNPNSPNHLELREAIKSIVEEA
jgi:hypothetical protein